MLFVVVVVAAITVQQHRRQANVKVEYAFKSAISQACKFITTYVGMNTDMFGIHVQTYVRHIAHSTLTQSHTIFPLSGGVSLLVVACMCVQLTMLHFI